MSQAAEVRTNFARTSSRPRHQVHEPGVVSALGDVTYLGLDRNGQVDACDDVVALGADLLTVVGHKLSAPKGIGALHVRRGIRLRPLIGGCGQEHGLRAGTENVAAAIGFGEAAELAPRSLADGESRDCASCATAPSTGSPPCSPARSTSRDIPPSAPNTANIRIDGVPALGLLADLTDVVISAGSACHSGRDEPSSVLTALEDAGMWALDSEDGRA